MLFRTCFVATNLMMTLKLIPNCCVVRLSRFGQVRDSFLIACFSCSAALLQVVLQAKMEPLRNGLSETRNRAVEMRNGLEILLVPVKLLPQKKHRKLTCIFKFVLVNFSTWRLCYPMKFCNIFQLWKIPLIFVYTNICCVGAGISTSTSISDGFGPCIFRQKYGEDGPYEGKIGWKAVDFPPESAFCFYS